MRSKILEKEVIALKCLYYCSYNALTLAARTFVKGQKENIIADEMSDEPNGRRAGWQSSGNIFVKHYIIK